MLKKIIVCIALNLSLAAAQPVGLYNSGNTCYMNAPIQCLYNIAPLTNFLLLNQDKYLKDVILPDRTTATSVAYEYIELLKKLKQRSSPVATITFCQRMWPALRETRGQQGDAQEFVSNLIDHVSALDLKKDANTRYYGFPFNYIPKGMPGELFLGIQTETLNNVLSGTLSHKKVLFNILTLPILISEAQKKAREDAKSTNKTIDVKDYKSVSECLNDYFKEESIFNNDAIIASKKIELDQLPPYLIISLKRFEFLPDGNRLKIDFPINTNLTLDFKPYVVDILKAYPAEYRLISVVMHSGNFGGGHYNAFVMSSDPADNQQWYLCDDSYTFPITNIESALLDYENAKRPYVLFYEKITPGAIMSPPIGDETLIESDIISMLTQNNISNEIYNNFLATKNIDTQNIIEGIMQGFITMDGLKDMIKDYEKNYLQKLFFSLQSQLQLLCSLT